MNSVISDNFELNCTPNCTPIFTVPNLCRTHGIFRLTTPGGMSVIRKCPHRGFHPHENPPDGGRIYDQCSDVYMNPNLRFDVVDFRWSTLPHSCEFTTFHSSYSAVILSFLLYITSELLFKCKVSKGPSDHLFFFAPPVILQCNDCSSLKAPQTMLNKQLLVSL